MAKGKKKNYNRINRMKLWSIFFAVILVGAVFIPMGIIQKASAHVEEPIFSPLTLSPPTIDGNWTPGEWSDAVMVDLTPIANNNLGTYMYIMNNDTYLFILYDAFGDNTEDPMDGSAVGFDSNHDGVNGPNDGDDDYFGVGSFIGTETHYEYNISAGWWQMHCSPFSDPGLAVAMGFNTTPNSGSDHRIYEWSIPLDQLDAGPGSILGFAAGCQEAPGIFDGDTFSYDQWPVNPMGPILLNQYGNLIIGSYDGVYITPEKQEKAGLAGQVVSFMLTITNIGVNSDLFDISYTSSMGWGVEFYDSSWNPLVDTGGGPEVDTGKVISRTSVDIYVNVTIPGIASAGDIDITVVQANSSNNSTMKHNATLKTGVPFKTNWFDGFEAGWDGWSTEVISPGFPSPTNWELGDPLGFGPGSAFNGTECAGTNIDDVYYMNADICLVTPYVELSSGMQILTFYHWYEMETGGEDGGFVEISVDNDPWSQIWPLTGYSYLNGYMGGYNTDGYSGSSMGWFYNEFDLSAYSGQVIRVRFHFAASPWWGGQAGWYLDDVYIGDPPPYRCQLTPDYQVDVGRPPGTVDYILTLKNTGANDETFDLTVIGGWTVTFRDIGDTTDIKSIFLTSGSSQDFIARVNIPMVPPGSYDIATITASSQNDSMVSDDAQIDTNIPVPPPAFDDMESGVGPWRVRDNGMGTSWQLGDPSLYPGGPPSAYSPTNCWGTNIIADYTTGCDATLTTPFIDLKIAVDANITFWHWYDINGFWNDAGWVEVSEDRGSSWDRIYPTGDYPDWDWNGYPCYAGSSGGWVQAEFDLSSYTGSFILIRFHLQDYTFDGPTEGAGWYIDDVNVSATYVAYGVELIPDQDFEIEPDGTSVLYLMTAINLGTSGPDSFDLKELTMLGWPVAFYDLSMNPITSVGPIPTAGSLDFYVEVSIPGGELPMTQETTLITATSQNDTSGIPASDTSTLITEVLAPILFVDDDGGIDTENQFEAAFADGGYEYNTWNYQLYGPPDLAELSQHTVVIWCTGNTYDDTIEPTLSPTDRANLGTYLDNGGRLYLSSAMAGLDASNDWGGTDTWLSWYNTYLHADYNYWTGGGTQYVVNGVSGDPISDGLNFDCWTGDFNPSLWGYWTHNDAINNGDVFFTEPAGPSNIGIRAETGIYRIVYTGFDFATINGAVNRSTLMDKIIQWLLYGDIPYVLETTPMDGALGVAVDQNIIVVYSEAMDTSVTPVLLQVGGPDPGGWSFLGWSTTYVADDTATWSHNSWTASQTVNMSVSGGQDLDANTAFGLLWGFTVVSALNPWANATGPTSSGTNDTNPTIFYNFGNSPTNIQIYWSDDGGTSWNMWGTDNTVDGSWSPLTPLPASGTYYWSARAMGGPSEPQPTGPGDIESGPYVLDIDAPWIFSTTPPDEATGVSTAAGIYVIEFNEPMSPVGTPSTDLPITLWNWALSGLWLNGTYTALSLSTTYYVDLTGLGFQDAVGNGLTGDTYKNFTTSALVVPWANATGPVTLLTNDSNPIITYDFGNGPTSIEIYYSDDGGSSWTYWGTDASVDGSWSPGTPLAASGTYYWNARAIGPPDESVPTGSGDIEIGTYVLDIDPPTIAFTTPPDEATGVSTAAGTYVIEFNEPMSLVGTPSTDLPITAWNWASSGLWLNGTYTVLAGSSIYYVDLTALGFQDLAGNSLTGDTYKNFTTEAPVNPWATATGPVSSGTNDASPTIFYDYNNTPTTVEIYYSSNGGSSWTYWGTDSSVEGSWTPGTPLPASGTYYWNARAMGTQDEPVPTGPGDIEIGTYVLDIDAPTISSTTPPDGAPSVSPAAGTYVIRFSEPMSLVGTPLSDLPGISWAWDTSGLWLNGTYNALASGTTYYVDLTGQGFQDLVGNALTGDTYKDFTTATGPWASVTGPLSAGTNNDSPTIMYDYGSAPTSVEIYYSDNGGATWTLWGTDASVDNSWPAGSPLPSSGTYYWNARALGASDEPIPTGVTDIESGPYVLDIAPPTIMSTIPIDEAIGVSTGAGIFVIRFSEPMTKSGTPLSDLPITIWAWDTSGLWLNGTYTALSPGITYYVDLTGLGFTDLVGNALTGDTYKNFTTSANPWANATGPISSLTNNASPTIFYNYGNAPTDVEIYYSTDGGSTWTLWGTDSSVNGSWTPGTSLPSSGTYYWNARALGAPNESVPTGPGDIEAGSYILDIVAPTISSTTPQDGATGIGVAAGTYVIQFSEPMALTGTVTSNLPGVSWNWDASGLWLNGTYTALALGTMYYADLGGVGFQDIAGNPLSGDAYKNFTTQLPDTTKPTVVSIVLSDPSPTKAGTVTFTITFSEAMNTSTIPVVTFGQSTPFNTYNIIQSSYSGNTWVGTFSIGSGTGDGTYTIRVSGAKDLAGNTMNIDESTHFIIDTTAPSSSVNTLSNYKNSLTFDIGYTAGDGPGSGIKYVELYYRIDGGIWTKYGSTFTSSPISFTATSDGFYEFYTIAYDNADNVEADSASPDASTKVDTTIPTILSVVLSDPSPTKAGTVTFTITFSENMNTGINPVVTFGLASPYTTHTVSKISYSGNTWIGTIAITTGTGDGTNTISISGAKDLAGNEISIYTTTFVVDTKPPAVTLKTPVGKGISKTTTISVTFNESMNKTTVQNAFSYTDGTTTWTIANGSFSWSGTTFTFTPASELSYETSYTVKIEITASDLAGNTMASAYSWSFTTLDITPPEVSSVSLEGKEVEVTNTLRITFDEPMNKSSVEAAISISPDIEVLNYTWEGNTLIITFASDLKAGTDYTVTVGTGASDEAGNALEEPYIWTFTTKEKAAEGISPVLFILPIIIIIIILLLLFMMKKKGKPEELPEEGEAEEAPEEEERPESDEEIGEKKTIHDEGEEQEESEEKTEGSETIEEEIEEAGEEKPEE